MFGNTYRYILNNSLTFIYDKPTSNIWGILESGPIEQILIAFPLEIMKYELFKTLKINLSLLPPSLSLSLSLSLSHFFKWSAAWNNEISSIFIKIKQLALLKITMLTFRVRNKHEILLRILMIHVLSLET